MHDTTARHERIQHILRAGDVNLVHRLERRAPDSDRAGRVKHDVAIAYSLPDRVGIADIRVNTIVISQLLAQLPGCRTQTKDADVADQRQQLPDDLPAEEAGAAGDANAFAGPVAWIRIHGKRPHAARFSQSSDLTSDMISP